jgi:hypothetical protein
MHGHFRQRDLLPLNKGAGMADSKTSNLISSEKVEVKIKEYKERLSKLATDFQARQNELNQMAVGINQIEGAIAGLQTLLDETKS